MDSSSLQDLQKMFEFELKRKLTERAKRSSGEMRILFNNLKFFDKDFSGIIDKNEWIKGILRTGLSGFSESDLDSLFSVYDKNNSGKIDYNNFCAFIYGREQLNPLSNQSPKINDDINANNMEQINQNQNIYYNNQVNDSNQFQENINQNIQNNQIRNYNEGVNINMNEIQTRQKTPLYNNIKNNNKDNFENIKRTPISYNNSRKTPTKDCIDYENNNNLRENQRNNNDYNKAFNNSLQQDKLISNHKSYYNNINEKAVNSIISFIKNCINTNNGITLFTFIKKLKEKQLNNQGISLNDLYNILLEMSINISLNDLKILFNVLNKNNNIISIDQLINLIKGNLDEKRKIIIVTIFEKIDSGKKGKISIQLLKEIFNAKNHPEVLKGIKSQEGVFEQFCNSLDLYCEVNDVQNNGSLTLENFIDYYSGVSACIHDDVYFENFLKGIWNYDNNMNNNIIYNDTKETDNNNNSINEQNDTDIYGMNSILIGISEKDRNRRKNFNINQNSNNSFRNNNRIRYNDSFKNIIQSNNNNLINQFNNNIFNDSNRIKRGRRLKNSASSPFISCNSIFNSSNKNNSNNILNDNINNTNNYPYNQSPSIFNTISLSQKASTPFNMSRRAQEGIKVFKNKIRYNPITGEYYKDFKNNSNYSNEDNIIYDKYSTIQNNASNSNNTLGIIEHLKNKLISRGPKSIFNFQRMLSIYDYNHSGQISLENFTTIFLTYNLNFSISDIQNIFKRFDKEQTGSINYDLLTNNIIGQINDRRKNIVQKVFDNFYKNVQNEVALSEIKQKYNAGRHPDVVNGRKSREEEFGDFLDKLEIFREYNDNLKMSYSTTMNLNEFLKFYTEISMFIKDDNLFDNILINCWNINDVLDNSNVNNENFNYNRNYDKNIRERTGKQIMSNRPY